MVVIKNFRDKEGRSKRFLKWIINKVILDSKSINFLLLFFLTLTPFILYQYRKQIYNNFPQVVKDTIRDTYINEIKLKDLPNIPINYINSFFYNVEKLEINITQRNLEKIRKAREDALKIGNLMQSKNDKVNAVIKYGDSSLKVRLRLKGDIVDHLYGSQWSYRVELKNDKSLFGMEKFSLQTPKTRNYLGEWIFHRLLEYEGLPSLRYKLVNVYLNGKNLGIYSIEEHFDKITIENNRYREGPIFALDETRWWLDYSKPIKTFSGSRTEYEDDFITRPIKVFDLREIISNKSLNFQFAYGSKLLEKFLNDEIPISDVFEIDKLAKFLAIIDLNGSDHSLHWNNMRLYLNPITKKFIPIGFDSNGGRNIYSLSINHSSLFHEKVLLDNTFMELYVKNLQRISKKLYWQNFISSINDELREKNSLISKTYPWYKFKNNPEYIKHNQQFIKQSLNPNLPLNAFITEISKTKLNLNINNKIKFPFQILGVYKGNELLYAPKSTLIVDSRRSIKPRSLLFLMESVNESSNQNNFDNKYLLAYKLIGTEKVNYLEINNFSKTKINNVNLNDIAIRKNNVDEFSFIKKDTKNKTLTFKPGNHEISRPLITPLGYKLIANNSTSINLVDKGLILSKGPINFMGTKNKPLFIDGINDGKGIYVLKADEVSIIENVSFTNLSSGINETSSMLGSITFYESNVRINNVSIDSNNSEDALNIFRSKFEIINTSFKNTRSDALDIDFGSGKLENLSFINIGNDAIDLSGSTATMKNIFVSTVGDKAVSIGEKSRVIIENLKLEKAAIGLASKDFSIIDGKNIKMNETEVGFVVFQKKPEYGPAKINVINDNNSNLKTDKLYLLENPSIFTLNSKTYKSNVKNVEQYLYGKIYGKKTLR